MSSRDFTLAEVLEAVGDRMMAGARTSLPGQILSYDSSKRRATVQVLPMDVEVDGDGVRETITIAPLTDVPFAHFGSGTARIKIPVRKGDRCWLSFSSSSISKLKAGAGGVYDPGTDRHQHLADAIAEPWTYTGESMDDASIEFTESGQILHGKNAIEPALLGNAFLSAHATMIAAIATAVGGIPTGGAAAASGITAALGVFQAAAATYIAQIVKVK